MRYFALIALGTLMVVAGAAWAADGDAVARAAGSGFGSKNLKGQCSAVRLCDAKAASSAVICPAAPGFQTSRPAQSYMFFVDDVGADCTAYTVLIQHTQGATGDPHTVCTLGFGATTACVVSGTLAEYVNASITVITTCTDLDVTMEVCYE